MFLGKSKATRGSTLVDYGIILGLVAALSVTTLALMGGEISETMERSGDDIAEANDAASGPSTSTAPQLNDLSPAQINQLETVGSILFQDGTFVFVGGTRKEGTQTVYLTDPQNVTLRWIEPSDCPTGPFSASGTISFTCDYADPSNGPALFLVRVPGDGYLASSEKSGIAELNYCSRATSDPADAHEFYCAEGI